MKVLIRILRRPYVALALLCLLAVPALVMAQAAQQAPQQAAQDEDLPAEDIIEILQQNPDVLAEAKTQIVAQLRDRGYAVTERSITDDRLFAEIRTDDRVRHLMSQELKSRGFGAEQSAEGQAQQPPATPATANNNAAARPGVGTQPAANNGAQAPVLNTRPREDARKPRATTQDQYPFRNLPALRDLYLQAVTDQAQLERFGAALFRNSTAVANDKTPIDIPVGEDYVIGPGDELVVEYWGSTSQRLTLMVDREGRVVLPDTGAMVVAGRTLGEARQGIQRLLTKQLRNIVVDVTLGKLRTVRAYVVGDVKNPGAYDISSLSWSHGNRFIPPGETLSRHQADGGS